MTETMTTMNAVSAIFSASSDKNSSSGDMEALKVEHTPLPEQGAAGGQEIGAEAISYFRFRLTSTGGPFFSV